MLSNHGSNSPIVPSANHSICIPPFVSRAPKGRTTDQRIGKRHSRPDVLLASVWHNARVLFIRTTTNEYYNHKRPTLRASLRSGPHTCRPSSRSFHATGKIKDAARQCARRKRQDTRKEGLVQTGRATFETSPQPECYGCRYCTKTGRAVKSLWRQRLWSVEPSGSVNADVRWGCRCYGSIKYRISLPWKGHPYARSRFAQEKT
jgi:hypothetical protein